jgi:hypothetical protein
LYKIKDTTMKSKEEKLFYERHIPELLRQVARLADAMENQNKINEKLLVLEKKKYQLSIGAPINESLTPKKLES